MLEQGMTWHTMQEIWDRGFKDVMREAVSEALAKADKLYVSVDIDVRDPAHAPGTGTPEPGGITTADLLRMVRQLLRTRRGGRRCRRGRARLRSRPTHRQCCASRGS
jgi:arginase family enzyme